MNKIQLICVFVCFFAAAVAQDENAICTARNGAWVSGDKLIKYLSVSGSADYPETIITTQDDMVFQIKSDSVDDYPTIKQAGILSGFASLAFQSNFHINVCLDYRTSPATVAVLKVFRY